MVYFTSDLHLGHRAIISMQNRPFDLLEEMDRVILSNFNAVIHRNDTVYILGDICHHMKVDAANEIISGLNGKKYLLIGNHDKKYDPALFCEMRDFMSISVNGQRFVLMHTIWRYKLPDEAFRKCMEEALYERRWHDGR